MLLNFSNSIIASFFYLIYIGGLLGNKRPGKVDEGR